MFQEILSKLGAALCGHDIPYMIIGGQAVLLYGEPRLTRDVDITLGVNIDRADDVLAVADELGFIPIPDDIDSFLKQTMVLPVLDNSTGIRVDFIFSFTPYEMEAIERSRKITILGQEVCFASPEDLIIHKVFAGRPRDIEDVRNIALKNRNLDAAYIRSRLGEFDAITEGSCFVRIFEEILEGL